MIRKVPGPDLSRAQILTRYHHDRLGFLLRLSQEYGPLVDLKDGNFLVNDPQFIRGILRDTNKGFASNQNMLRDKVDGVTGTETLDRWMQSRRVAVGALAGDAMQAERDAILRDCDELIEKWRKQPLVSSAVDDLQRVTNRAIVRYTLGGSEQSSQAADRMLDALFPFVSSHVVLPRWMRLRPRDFRVKHALRKLEHLVSQRLQDSPTSYSEALRTAGLPFKWQVQVTISVLLAANRVPAAAAAWSLAEFLQAPDVQRAVAADAASSETATTQAFIKEVLRLWPPSWLLGRQAISDSTVRDHRIPAGSHLLISSWLVHRSPESWADPFVFSLGRWNSETPPAGAYLPFGAGSRYCLGSQFAQFELTLLTQTLAQADLQRAGPLAYTGIDSRSTLVPEGLHFAVR